MRETPNCCQHFEVARLAAGADPSKTWSRLLRSITPFSLAGALVAALPCNAGGMQPAAARGCDEPLVEFASQLDANPAEHARLRAIRLK